MSKVDTNPSLDIDALELWIPPDTYSFAAWETFKGDTFRLRTGDKVSVLNLVDSHDFELLLKGPVNIDNDEMGWAIAIKFGKLPDVVNTLVSKGYKEGYNNAKQEIREALGVGY